MSAAPLLLALDTATHRPCFALGTRLDPGSDTVLADRRALSGEIEQVVRGLVEPAGGPGALGGVVVADGPGSFTGLRIGIAFAKGLAKGLGIPFLTAPSMMAAACAVAKGEGRVEVRYDALRGEVFRAVYGFGPGVVTVLHHPSVEPAVAAAPAGGDRRATESDASARALITLTALQGGAQRVADVEGWEPDYGRMAEAEARLRAATRKPGGDAPPA